MLLRAVVDQAGSAEATAVDQKPRSIHAKLRRMSEKALMSYSHAFLLAADRHATAAKMASVDGQVDGMMCVIALQNAFAGATKLLGADHPAVKDCLVQARDLKDLRDMLTHFDDYALGTGRLQKPTSGTDGPFGWMPMWNSNETIAILTRRRGEKEATYYEVSIHEALRAVGGVVAAAASSLGLEPSPLRQRLTAADG